MVESSCGETSTERAAPSRLTAEDFGIGQLFDVVPDAVIVGDAASGRIVLWNPSAAAMFGYEHDEGAGLLIEDLVPTEMRAAHRDGIARLAHTEPTPLIDSESMVELPALRKDGTSLWVELRLAHIAGPDRGRFALAVIRDATIRREAEIAREGALRELEELREALERENRDLDLVARTDHLTEVWNRRHVDEHLTMAISSAKRHQRPLAVLLVDVDEFKGVNGRFGHPAGDATLREVASRLRRGVRAEDTLGRWGGDEFLIVLPDAGVYEALAAAERLRGEVSSAPVVSADASISITVSIGVAGTQDGSHDDVLEKADAALSRAKAAGRNRTSI